MPHDDEHEWVLRARGGDQAAFAALADRYYARLYRWLYSLTQRAHTAEDLAQDAFLKAWAALPTFQPGTSFRAWLFRIAGNCFLDSRRGPRGTAPRELPADLTGRDEGPVAAVIGQECRTRVEEAVDRLPVKFRAALLLRTREGLSFAEIAQALGITEETVRWRVFKARQLLLKSLGSYLDGGTP